MRKKTVKAYCEICEKLVDVIIDESFKINESGLSSIEYIHGEPKHTLVVYLDKHLTVRGEAVIKTDNPCKALSELKKTHIKKFKNKLKKLTSNKKKE
ncbi:MAG: hypothetical protein ACTSYR_03345 [Candidatus Odinarchaeia archaeon]